MCVIPPESRVDNPLPRTPEEELIEQKLMKLGHEPENRHCNHSHWSFEKHGTHCTCGTVMEDCGM